jgi:hypothetical protein
MLAPVSTEACRASAKEALSRKCPRFVKYDGPILEFLSAAAQMGRIVQSLPASVEAIEHPLTDGGVSYEFRKARVAQVKAA